MRRLRASGGILVLALTLAACSFPSTVAGVVTALPADCATGTSAPAASAAPATRLAGATVTLRCPNGQAVSFSATADAEGLFVHRTEQRFPLDCELVVASEGYMPRTYRMKDVCARQGGKQTCDAATLTARLVRQTPGGAQ